MSDEAKAPSLGDVVGAAAFLVGLITAWLYIAGWSYAYDYFNRFRIPLLLAEIPREHMFVYGALTIWKNALLAVATGIAIIGLATACVQWSARIGRSLMVALLTVAVIALFVLARQAGTHTAAGDFASQRATDYVAYPRVAIDLIPDAAADAMTEAIGLGCARLVLATGDRIFLVVPKIGAPALELNTIVLPWEPIRAMTVSGQYSSCE